MSQQALDFFSKNQQVSKTRDAIEGASSTGEKSEPLSVAGSYIMKCKTIVAKKKDGELLLMPGLKTSTSTKSAGALQLDIALEVIVPTEVVPKGASIFNTITLAQADGATDEKIRNTASYMKPVICALTGLDKFDFTPDFVNEYLGIDYDPETLKVLRNHKMIREVMVICEEYPKSNGTKGIRVKTIRQVRPGEVSSSIKQEAVDNAELIRTADAIEASAGTVTVETSALDYDPNMDSAEFQVEDA
jgi:hypothetical protein